MAILAINNVTRQFGTQVVLDGATFEVETGDIVGLIGANGSGKTTLLRMLAGMDKPDTGDIIQARGLSVGLLAQEPVLDLKRTLHDEVAVAFEELLALEHKLQTISEEMGECDDDGRMAELMKSYDKVHHKFIASGGEKFEAKLHEVLGGLGFSLAEYGRKMSEFSGGQRCRAALARLLLTDSSFLLLDEPTNHLDIDAVRWLEYYLGRHPGGAMVVSHDRYLLDRVCTRIVELENGKTNSFTGNYSAFASTKELRLLTQERQFEKDKTFIEKERAFIAKHLSGQRTKEAQGRRTRLNRRLGEGEFVTEVDKSKRSARIAFRTSQTHDSGVVLRCDELAFSYDKLAPLFSDLSFQLYGSERLGITGANGCGKTTLLRILISQLTPTEGTLSYEQKVSIGYFSQESFHLDPKRTMIEEIRSVKSQLTEEAARTFMGQFLFSGQDVFKPMGLLSGGEQSRVRLASLILEQPDLLILDEPTNHLDIASREALERTLQDFPGTIIVVSHDRYFLDQIASRMLVFRVDGYENLVGNYSECVAQIDEKKAKLAAQAKQSSSGKGNAATKKNRKSAVAKSDPKIRLTAQYDHLTGDQLEAMVMEKEVAIAQLNARFGDADVHKNPDMLGELQEELTALEAEFSVLDQAWQERADA